jgi:hypothetical protein
MSILGFGGAGAILSAINRLLRIFEKWFDDRRIRKVQEAERAKIAAENNEHVYQQLDSARKTKGQVEGLTEEEIDAILDQGRKH